LKKKDKGDGQTEKKANGKTEKKADGKTEKKANGNGESAPPEAPVDTSPTEIPFPDAKTMKNCLWPYGIHVNIACVYLDLLSREECVERIFNRADHPTIKHRNAESKDIVDRFAEDFQYPTLGETKDAPGDGNPDFKFDADAVAIVESSEDRQNREDDGSSGERSSSSSSKQDDTGISPKGKKRVTIQEANDKDASHGGQKSKRLSQIGNAINKTNNNTNKNNTDNNNTDNNDKTNNLLNNPAVIFNNGSGNTFEQFCHLRSEDDVREFLKSCFERHEMLFGSRIPGDRYFKAWRAENPGKKWKDFHKGESVASGKPREKM
jgi:hypothetical protein